MTLALLYSLISAAATLVGGSLPIFTRLKNLEIRYMLAFATGVVIAAALFDLLPEVNITKTSALVIGLGFFSLYFIEKAALIHACGEKECKVHTIGWVSLIGIAIESFFDGVAIAASFAINQGLGLIIAFAVIVHEVPRGFSTSVIMRASMYSFPIVIGALLIDAFTPVLGVLMWPFLPFDANLLTAFVVGTFIYIGASDLLPDAHEVFNWKVIFAVLFGAFITLLASYAI